MRLPSGFDAFFYVHYNLHKMFVLYPMGAVFVTRVYKFKFFSNGGKNQMLEIYLNVFWAILVLLPTLDAHLMRFDKICV